MNKFLKNVRAYFIGHFRHKLYYSKFKFLLNKHIVEQFEFRLKSMNKACYNQGSCVECGCMTTALQMADKACDGDCYPPFLNKLAWLAFNEGNTVVDEKGDRWLKRKELIPGNAKALYKVIIRKNEQITSTYYEPKQF